MAVRSHTAEPGAALRILLVTLGHPKYAGDSTAPFMARIVEALAARGHRLDVVLPYHPEFRYPAGPGVTFLPYRYSPFGRYAPWGFGGSLKGSSRIRPAVLPLMPSILLSLSRRLRQSLQTRSYDVVHAHWLVPNAWVAAGPSAAHAVPLVVTLHGSDVAITERLAALRPLGRRTLTRASAVTAVSEDLRNRVVALGADPRSTRVVHLGIDTDRFVPRSPSADVRRALGASDGDILVVAVGRLVEKKGFQVLIEAASRVERIHVAIVGDGDLRSKLEDLARARDAKVTFTGDLDQTAVGDALAAADVVALPSVVDSAGNLDGLPTTLLEAAAAGKAVIATDLAGNPEVISHGVNGLLVPPNDAPALAEAIRSLRDDSELRQRLGREARATAVASYDWRAAGSAFEGVYNAVIRRAP